MPEPKPKTAPAAEPALELDLPPKPVTPEQRGAPDTGPVSGRVTPPSRSPGARTSGPGVPQPRPLEGFAGQAARALGVAASALVRLSRFGVSKARKHGGKAIHDFAQRPEHARWRALAFGGYLFICVATFGAQLWEPNSLKAYVKVQPVALPESTVIFVRNDSTKTWKDVKLTLNGIYGYERNELTPGSHVLLKVDRFAVFDGSGKATFAPKDIPLKLLTIDCDRGHFEQELDK